MPNSEHYPEVAPAHDKQTLTTQSEIRYTNIPSSDPEVHAQPQRRVCGLTLGVFAIIVGLVALLIGAGKTQLLTQTSLFTNIPAAIGGGVAGSSAVNSCNEKLAAIHSSGVATCTPTRPPTASSTSDSDFIAYNIPVPETSCGESNFTSNYTTESNFFFNKVCDHDIVGFDIVGSVALTWELCMEECGRYNAYRNGTDPTSCAAVTFVPSWVDEGSARRNISFWANCFLKYKAPDLNTVKNAEAFSIVVSVLQS